MYNSSSVSSDVYVGGTVQMKHQAYIGGEIHYLEEPQNPCLCGYDLNSVLAWRRSNNDNALLLADPAIAPYIQQGSLKVLHNDTITLPPGAYFFESILISNRARVFARRGGIVEIYVADSLRVENNSVLSAASGNPAELLVVVGGIDSGKCRALVFENNIDLALSVFAPRADLYYPNNVKLLGTFVVRNLNLRNHGRIMAQSGACTTPAEPYCR